jgi:hypothetical protein
MTDCQLTVMFVKSEIPGYEAAKLRRGGSLDFPQILCYIIIVLIGHELLLSKCLSKILI